MKSKSDRIDLDRGNCFSPSYPETARMNISIFIEGNATLFSLFKVRSLGAREWQSSGEIHAFVL